MSCQIIPAVVVVVTVALGLSGCALLPETPELAAVRSVDQSQGAETFSAPASSWPEERWWRGYGDPQLDQLIDEGLAQAPELTVAAARLRAAEAVGQIAGSVLSPQVIGNGSALLQQQSYRYLTPRAMTPEGWQDYGRATLDFSWELDFWGRHRAALAAATSEQEARRAEMAQARLLLATGIASAYAELSRLFAVHDTVARSVEVRTQTARLFAERFANGLETRGSQREAEARQLVAEGERLQLEEQIGLQRNRLAALLGAGPDRGLAIKRPHVRLERRFALPPSLAVDLLGRRPDVVAARLQVEAGLSRIDEKKAGFYPNVNLAAFVGVHALGLDLLTRGDASVGSVGPAISLPIFSGGRLRGELRGAHARYDEAVGLYNRTVIQALQEVADAAVSQKSLAVRLDKAEQTVRVAGDAYHMVRNRYEGGLASYLEVLAAEDLLLNSRHLFTDLQARSLTLDVALMRALGGGYLSLNP
jgi:NodT family efflux transporter outer membrane factor (OMF) lipoprotein